MAWCHRVDSNTETKKVTPSYKVDVDNDFGGIRIPEFLKKNRNK